MEIQLLAAKGLLGYIDGEIPKPVPSSTPVTDTTTAATAETPIYSTNPTLDEWIFRDHVARAHIVLNCTNALGLGVVTTGTAKEAYDSIQNEWGKITSTIITIIKKSYICKVVAVNSRRTIKSIPTSLTTAGSIDFAAIVNSDVRNLSENRIWGWP